ncbi:unnamed protein product [Didymodactylos carnosus]|uniref:Guanylate-binding protein N-terminal domain-containing protein n=1 Tax=Didymodactylos carnosus TaxID=1234261 RepID=A0A814KR49_9BILA|nr:unnamed protein product [Didymodactylos carnosus]CAF1054718.1 unnamed protein product [Didymodactylos carnosus]CAF3690513.1 unnamed protein product [Didymodactylos carnosus]CAF3823887.1 unnamed protein product [Didymodactylos carnosus]
MDQQANDQQEQHPGCIELIRCIEPTTKQRNDFQYVPHLEINKEAQEIISERFKSPISIVVYVGNVGAGKSKLATLTVETLQQDRSNPPLRTFRSGAGISGVTHGVWMWHEPLQHPDETKEGSILLLDCEGMGDLDENTSAKLYLFCMIISTAFAVILRPARVDHLQCDRLYNALKRCENMGTPFILPNLWLVPLDMPEFVYSDPKRGDIKITKEQWLQQVFSVSSNALSTNENQLLASRYEYITRQLPQIGVVNLDYLPRSLMNNSETLDTYTLLRSSPEYFESLKAAIYQLLSHSGKRLPGSGSDLLFVRPAELAALMGELIDVLNNDKMPNPDALIGRYLLTRFTDQIVEQQMAQFKEEILADTEHVLCSPMRKQHTPETPDELNATNTKMRDIRNRLITKYLGTVVGLARYQIYGLDSNLSEGYDNVDQQKQALLGLPKLVQDELINLQAQMNRYQEPELLIEQTRTTLAVKDLHRQQQEERTLLEEIKKKLENKRDLVFRQKRINISLKNANSVRVGLAPCSQCGRVGGAVNITHPKQDCTSHRTGNYYYYHNDNDRMVCDACREIKQISTTGVECSRCGAARKVTRYF